MTENKTEIFEHCKIDIKNAYDKDPVAYIEFLGDWVDSLLPTASRSMLILKEGISTIKDINDLQKQAFNIIKENIRIHPQYKEHVFDTIMCSSAYDLIHSINQTKIEDDLRNEIKRLRKVKRL